MSISGGMTVHCKFLSSGKELASRILNENMETSTVEVGIPMDRGFHSRPSLLVAKIVGLKKKRQVGEHHPEGKEIEEVGDDFVNAKPDSAKDTGLKKVLEENYFWIGKKGPYKITEFHKYNRIFFYIYLFCQ